MLLPKNRVNIIGLRHKKSHSRIQRIYCVPAPVFSYPAAGEKFILDNDASEYGIGCVLSRAINGTEKVIDYYSRILSEPEMNYCITQRELLAVV